MAEALPMNDGVQETLDLIRARILHTLDIFPALSGSMIHIGLGTSTPTSLWRPILENLVADGIVVKLEVASRTPLDRNQTYTLYHLPKNSYIPSADIQLVNHPNHPSQPNLASHVSQDNS